MDSNREGSGSETKENEPPAKKPRFATVSEEGIKDLRRKATPEGTRSCTKAWLAVFDSYCTEKEKAVDLKAISATELNEVLRHFYVEVRQKNGQTYSRSSLHGIRAAIQRQLSDLGRNFNIFRTEEFAESNRVFESNLVLLSRTGQLAATKHKPPMPQSDLKKLLDYCNTALDHNDPVHLTEACWVYVTLHFGLRARELQSKLTKTDFEIVTRENGTEMIVLSTAFATKNHSGASSSDDDPSCGQIQDDLQIESFKKLLQKSNPENEKLFQKAKKSVKPEDDCWFHNVPLGKMVLGDMLKRLSTKASLSQEYTNHCLRATAITVLHEQGFSDRSIMAVSRHRNVQSLTSYQRPGAEERAQMCHSLDHPGDHLAMVPMSMSASHADDLDRSLVLEEIVQRELSQNVSCTEVVDALLDPCHASPEGGSLPAPMLELDPEWTQEEIDLADKAASAAQVAMSNNKYSNCSFSFNFYK